MADETRPKIYTASYWAGLLLWLGFGFIVSSVINAANLIEVKLHVPFVCASVGLIYLAAPYVVRHFEKQARLSAAGARNYRGMMTFSLVVQGIIGVGVLVSLPFVWWGVIKKLAALGNQGAKMM